MYRHSVRVVVCAVVRSCGHMGNRAGVGSMKKRLFRILLAAALLVVVSVAVVFYLVGRKGSGTIEGWIASQVQTIAGAYIKPKLAFSDLDYEYPLSVSLKNLTLTAEDPAHPGQAVDIVACSHAAISLGEIPSIGKPIVIEKIVLDGALISAVAVKEGTNEFIGFSDLLRDTAISDKPEEPSGPLKLSDALRMRLVQLVDGKITYDPRIPGTVPMMLDQINTSLKIEPTAEGYYNLNTVIARKPVFEVEVMGKLDLDSFTAHDIAVKLAADLGSDKLDYLPPELQKLLKQYDAKGKLNVAISGTMPVMDPMKGQVTADVTVDHANVAFGDFRGPVDSLSLSAKFADGKVVLPSLKVSSLDGTAEISGSATLNERLDANLQLVVSGMMLERVLAAGPSAYAPRLDLKLSVAGSLMTLLGKLPVEPGKPVASVGLKDFRFYGPDPAKPGKTVDLLACKNFEVALAEPIVEGKPLVIDKVVLDRPSIAAIAVAPNSMEFAGVPKIALHPTTAPTDDALAVASAIVPTEPQRKLSDIVRVNSFRMNDASVLYDARLPGTQRMWIDGINTAVTIDPVNPGRYRFSTNLGRAPVFEFAVGGLVDVNVLTLTDLAMKLRADFQEGKLDYLPPQLQAVLQQNEATGSLSVDVVGAVPLTDPAKGNVQVDVSVKNVNLASDGVKVPVENIVLKAMLADGKIVLPKLTIAAMQSVFDVTGSANLDQRMDAELTLKLKDVVLESLLASLPTKKPLPQTKTLLNGEVLVRSPVMVALGLAPKRAPDESIAALTVRDVRLSVDDPLNPGVPLNFVSLNAFGVTVNALPSPGKPIVVDRIVLDAPALRAIAIEPESNELAGISNLMLIADSFSGDEVTPATTKPVATTAASPFKLSELVQVHSFELTDASLYYDPRIEGSVPFSLTHVGAEVKLDSLAGDAYAYHLLVPAKPCFNFEANGRVNVDTMLAEGLKAKFTMDLSQRESAALPPQVQLIQKVYELEGMLDVDIAGPSIPLTDPTAAAIRVDVKLDNVAATVGDYRIPVEAVRLPVELKGGHLRILNSNDAMASPAVKLLDGTIDMTGDVKLDDVLTTNLALQVSDLSLEKFAATQLYGEKLELVGDVFVKANLTDAPLLTIVEQATPNASVPSNQAVMFKPLPDKWGTVDVEVVEARLAGLELIQGLGNLVKKAFVDVFKKEEDRGPNAVKPKEYAKLAMDLVHERVDLQEIYYEGEIVLVEGKGTVTLDQRLDIKLEGGPIAKMGGQRGFGKWVKDATNSLIYYHIGGTIQQYELSAKMGDGKPIGAGIDFVAKKTGGGIKKGAEATGKFFNKVFGKKKKPADESTE